MGFDFASLLMHVTTKTFAPAGDGESSSDCRNARGDATTNVLGQIDYEHMEIHNGDHYFLTDAQTINAGTSDAVDYLLVVPDTTKWVHMTIDADGSAKTAMYLYEDATVTPTSDGDYTGWTTETGRNNNRNSGNTPGLAIYSKAGTSDASSDYGDVITLYEYSGGSDTNQSRTPAAVRASREIILRQGIKYIYRVVSGTASNLCNVVFRWYEHVNR